MGSQLPGQSLTVQITGIRSAEGVIRISFFTNSRQFDEEIPHLARIVPKTGIRDGQMTLVFSQLPPGTYGIVVLDDKNENGKMDYRLIWPAEGYGFSGLQPGKLRRPSFEEFKFDFTEKDKTVWVRMLYW